MKQSRAFNVILAASSLSISVALLSPQQGLCQSQFSSRRHRHLASSSRTSSNALQHHQQNQERSYKTYADNYYAKHGCIPKPKRLHIELPIPSTKNDDNTSTNNILVIGDVHGCLTELKQLYELAVAENGNQPFDYVCLVGDLCNKGPYSTQVIQFVRQQNNWYVVRGNHDDAALAAALGDPIRRSKPSYQWIVQGDPRGHCRESSSHQQSTILSDDDILWLSELPYTIRIPGSIFGGDNVNDDIVVVHAGLVPGIPIEEQTIETMITLREVVQQENCWQPYRRGGFNGSSSNNNSGDAVPRAWASVWQGPPRIIFGHDAKRGVQRYPETGDWAIGLDSGCCYGKQLTGIILPSMKIVSVDANEIYSPIVKK